MICTDILEVKNPAIEARQLQTSTKNIRKYGYNMSAHTGTPIRGGKVEMDKRKVLEMSLKRLGEIARLPENWNNNGASVFSESIIRQAAELVRGLSIQPVILPTARDSIQMEYENSAGDYLEFELFENGRLKMFSYSHDGKVMNGVISANSMDRMVRSFYERGI